MRRLWCALLLAALAGPLPAPAPAQEPDAPEAELSDSEGLIAKLNAYTALLNRTARASESLARYASWVDMKAGPTGRERIVYGLYSLYDVRDETAEAVAATARAPRLPQLDTAILTYVAAYQGLAPTIDEAEGYYERQDYKVDAFAEGRALHARLAPMGQAFLAERARLEALYAGEKTRADLAQLALLERREGRRARWQVANVMMQARQIVALLPTSERPLVDLAAYDARLAAYAGAVREFDAFVTKNPDAIRAFDSRPRSLLGKLREFRETLAKARGDAARLPRHTLTFVTMDYSMMVSTAAMATRFAR